ncbi:MAG: peptidoglycan editing factor PgeF [Acidobacteria bacterium]|nr:peptidoglycan editing factor PgeF [Acidobacteriota bacterium]
MPLPSVPDPFYWTNETWGPALRCGALDPIAPHLFTSRALQLSSAEGRMAVAHAVGALEAVTLTQVHGNGVVVVRRGEDRPSATSEADVLVSDDPHVALAVRAADCVPLLLGDRRTGAVAAIHTGWRGTAAGAAAAAIQEMHCEFGTDPADIVAAIGPSIGACCYEVGSELVDAFAAAGHARHLIDRWFVTRPPSRGSRERLTLRLDVAGANRDQLILAGVPEEYVHASGLCTAEYLEVLTSFRAEKEKAGRLGGVIRARMP